MARRQRQRRLWLLGGTAVVLLIVLVAAVLVANNQGASACTADGGITCGTAAPDFTLPQVPGMKQVSLSSYKGHPVLIELFATWCPHCQREAPILDSLYTANHPKGLAMLSVVASPYDHNYESTGKQTPVTPADLTWFANTFHVQSPVLWDPQVANAVNSEAAIYQLKAYPTIYLLDKKGIIRWSGTGEIAQADLQAQISKLL